MEGVAEPLKHCPRCATPLVWHDGWTGRFCVRCWAAYRNGRKVPLQRVSPALYALVNDLPHEGRGYRLPEAKPEGNCSMCLKPCSGPLQQVHLVPVNSRPKHPLLHHPHNLVCLCRGCHRKLHRRADGYDFAEKPKREDVPPGGYGPLSLPYARWVVETVRPTLWLKALRLGSLLWGRLRERSLEGAEEEVPVALYHRWLYTVVGDANGIRAFGGVLYRFDPEDYERPLYPDAPGECRTYHVYGRVVGLLQSGPYLEPVEGNLRPLLTALLEGRGYTRKAIAELVRTQKLTKPRHNTLAGWSQTGRSLIERAEAGNKPVQDGSSGRFPRKRPLSLGSVSTEELLEELRRRGKGDEKGKPG